MTTYASRGRLALAAVALVLGTAARAESSPCRARKLPRADPDEVGVASELPGDLRALLRDARRRGVFHSAVLVVARRGRVVVREAVGRAHPDTLFDLASLTKVVVTAPLVMQLVERGKLSLSHPIGRYLRWLRGTDKAGLTIEQLMLHTAGLPPVVYAGPRTRPGQRVTLKDQWAKLRARIRRASIRTKPGQRYRYSDLGYVLLGKLIERVTGLRLDVAARRRLLRPLGMCRAQYAPRGRLLRRVLSPWPGAINKGVVYDPIAARMAGVSGHAGLFASADELVRYGLGLLGRSDRHREPILSRRTVRVMVRPHRLPGGIWRALGWKVDRPFSVSRGHLSPRAFGHTGYTGTSLWVDPVRQLVVVLLTDRTYRKPPRSVGPLRRRVHQLVRGAVASPRGASVSVGLDRLVARRFAPLRGLRVGLLTNRTAVDRRGRWIVDLLLKEKSVELAAIFAPEHGLAAALDRHLGDSSLQRGGRRIPVFSLYGRRRRPSVKSLHDLDALVFDVQTVGLRFYTYLATMGWAMEMAAEHKLRFFVLDRPNPLGGVAVEGPLSSRRPRTSTNYHPLPVRHGMTVGEIARLYNRERRIGARLTVIPMRGWERSMRFGDTGLRWIDPSPNIRSWRAPLLYAAVGLLESTKLAVGRGTADPFSWAGAPWVDAERWASLLNHRKLPGVYFVPTEFRPKSSRYRGRLCRGVRVLITEPKRFEPVRTGMEMAATLLKLHADDWDSSRLPRMLKHPPTMRLLLAGKPLRRALVSWRRDEARFRRLRRRYLLYR